MINSFHLSVEQLRDRLMKDLVEINALQHETEDKQEKGDLHVAYTHIRAAMGKLYGMMYRSKEE